MAELEIHTESEGPVDPFTHKVGIAVGIIGILLAGVTILGHREHTEAVVHKTEANDQWSFYQSKKIKKEADEIAAKVITALAPDATKVLAQKNDFLADAARYANEAETLKVQAEQIERAAQHSEGKALRFDLGEGLLELGLVMTSLYFLARRRFFVGLGVTAAALGTVVSLLGFLY